MEEPATIYIVDDESTILAATEAVLKLRGYHVCAYSDPQRFLEGARLHDPGCLISDYRMPGLNGLELLNKLNAASSPITTVVMSGVADVAMAVALMSRGAVTVLEKPFDHSVLLDAVERALLVSGEKSRRRKTERSIRDRVNLLSPDEKAVMHLMLEGKPNKLISISLNVSMRTVDRRRQSILEKMQVESVPQLAMLLSQMIS